MGRLCGRKNGNGVYARKEIIMIDVWTSDIEAAINDYYGS